MVKVEKRPDYMVAEFGSLIVLAQINVFTSKIVSKAKLGESQNVEFLNNFRELEFFQQSIELSKYDMSPLLLTRFVLKLFSTF